MRLLIYGLPGMGKTTFMHDYIRSNPGHRYFVVDHAEEWNPEATHWRGNPPKKMVILNGMGEALEPNEYEEDGVYVFRETSGLQVAQHVCEVGNAVYVDDEIDLVAQREGWNDSPIRALVHQGRHLRNAAGEITECHIFGACRRPQSLHTDLSGQADAVFIFRVTGERTLGRLKVDSHINADEWERVSNLPKFEFKVWTPDFPVGTFLKIPPIGTEASAPKPVPELPEQKSEDGPAVEFW